MVKPRAIPKQEGRKGCFPAVLVLPPMLPEFDLEGQVVSQNASCTHKRLLAGSSEELGYSVSRSEIPTRRW